MLSIIADSLMIATGKHGQSPDHREAKMRRLYLEKQRRIDVQRQLDIARVGGHW